MGVKRWGIFFSPLKILRPTRPRTYRPTVSEIDPRYFSFILLRVTRDPKYFSKLTTNTNKIIISGTLEVEVKHTC